MPTSPAPRSTRDPLLTADTFIVSLHTVVHAPRQTARTRAVLRACRDDVDRFWTGVEDGARFLDTRNCRVGGDGTLLLDHPLANGETCIVEYEVSRGLADRWEQVLVSPAWDLVLQVRFHPAAVPARCWGYRGAVVSALALTGGESVHTVTLDAQPGVHGIRWEW